MYHKHDKEINLSGDKRHSIAYSIKAGTESKLCYL